MRILVEEEYGYRYWSWEVKTSDGPPSYDAMKKYFDSVTMQKNWYCMGMPSDHFIGEWQLLDYDDYKKQLDSNSFTAWAHIHTTEDSNFVMNMENHHE